MGGICYYLKGHSLEGFINGGQFQSFMRRGSHTNVNLAPFALYNLMLRSGSGKKVDDVSRYHRQEARREEEKAGRKFANVESPRQYGEGWLLREDFNKTSGVGELVHSHEGSYVSQGSRIAYRLDHFTKGAAYYEKKADEAEFKEICSISNDSMPKKQAVIPL